MSPEPTRGISKNRVQSAVSGYGGGRELTAAGVSCNKRNSLPSPRPILPAEGLYFMCVGTFLWLAACGALRAPAEFEGESVHAGLLGAASPNGRAARCCVVHCRADPYSTLILHRQPVTAGRERGLLGESERQQLRRDRRVASASV